MSIISNAKRALAIAAAAATLLSMAACGSSNAASGKSDSSGAASSGKIEVVASINQWGSVAEDLGGSNVEVTNIMTKTNVEAHDYEPTSQDVAKFGTAKVAVVNGADYDPWATKAAQPTKATLVTAAEKVKKRDKLLQLTLKVGDETRTVLSGIASQYAPEEMVGKKVVLLYNLAPRKMRGVESQGMVLCGGDHENFRLLTVDGDVPDGSDVN